MRIDLRRRSVPLRALSSTLCLATGLVTAGMTLREGIAAAGILDPRFGTGGRVITEFDGALDIARAVVAQSNGRIVVVGSSDSVRPFEASNFAVARLLSTGKLDTGFGVGGRVITDFGDDSTAFAAAVQKDGKLVVAGEISHPGNHDFIVARYTKSGLPDPTFGAGGKIEIDLNSGSEDAALGVVVQPDGKIVAAGYTLTKFNFDVAAVRLTRTGSLDGAFGTGGRAVYNLAGTDICRSMALQKDGKLLLAGSTGADDFDFALLRLQTNGARDAGFGSQGLVRVDFGPDDDAAGIAVQSDGRIVLAGRTTLAGASDVAVARRMASGAPDPTFAGDGSTVLHSGDSAAAEGVALQSDGKIVVAGHAEVGGVPRFLVARILSNGASDTAFGSGGAALTQFQNGDRAHAVALQKDRKIVVAGETFFEGNNDFAVARYSAR